MDCPDGYSNNTAERLTSGIQSRHVINCTVISSKRFYAIAPASSWRLSAIFLLFVLSIIHPDVAWADVPADRVKAPMNQQPVEPEQQPKSPRKLAVSARYKSIVNQFPASRSQNWEPAKADAEANPTPAIASLSPSDEALLRKMNPKPTKHDSRSFIYPNLETCIKNKLLRPFVSRVLKGQVSDYRAAVRGGHDSQPPSTFEAHCRVVWDGTAILSVILSSETYIGGVTSSTSVTGLNLWKKSPEILRVNKVFKPGVSNSLAVFAAAEVLRNTRDESLALETFDLEHDEFENIVLSSDGVEFLFAKSELADDRTVKIPYATLLALLQPSFVKRACLAFNDATSSEAEKNLESSIITSAIGTLSEIIANFPDNGAAYSMRARWYKRLGRDEPAKADEQKARELTPTIKATD